MMRELVPKTAPFALLTNSTNPTIQAELRDLQAAAQAMGQKLLMLDASTPQGIDAAFVTMAQQGAAALLITVDASFDVVAIN